MSKIKTERPSTMTKSKKMQEMVNSHLNLTPTLKQVSLLSNVTEQPGIEHFHGCIPGCSSLKRITVKKLTQANGHVSLSRYSDLLELKLPATRVFDCYPYI